MPRVSPCGATSHRVLLDELKTSMFDVGQQRSRVVNSRATHVKRNKGVTLLSVAVAPSVVGLWPNGGFRGAAQRPRVLAIGPSTNPRWLQNGLRPLGRAVIFARQSISAGWQQYPDDDNHGPDCRDSEPDCDDNDQRRDCARHPAGRGQCRVRRQRASVSAPNDWSK